MKTLAEFFEEAEQADQAKYAAEREAEAKRWAALSPEEQQAEKDRIAAEYEAKWGAFDDAPDAEKDDDEEGDFDEEDDE